jgi:hypothetical protein
MHDDGGFLIERHLIRTAPSLRVARQATDQIQQHGKRPPGHVVLVGNPLPIRRPFRKLPFAEKEVKDMKDILNRASLEVLSKNHFCLDQNPPATKTNVKSALEGAAWAHMVCHCDLDTDALVLASPRGSKDRGTTVARPRANLACMKDLMEMAMLEEMLEMRKSPTEFARKLNRGFCGEEDDDDIEEEEEEEEEEGWGQRKKERKRSPKVWTPEMAQYLIAYHQDMLEELRRKLHFFDLMKAECGNYTAYLALEVHRVVKERKPYNPDALGECNNVAPKPAPNASDLSMHDVQGGEGEQGVQLAHGATVILSACNTGRGEIKAEGVVGLARGFLLANASAAVVSLWSVDDGSTAALMRIKYEHLAQGCTVPQALRRAMLGLARRPSHNQTPDRDAGD